MAPRKTENNAYAKFWGDKQRALWYVMVFSGVVNYTIHHPSFYKLRYPIYIIIPLERIPIYHPL